MVNTFIHSRSSLENHTRFQTKMGKVYITHFQTQKGPKTIPFVAVHTYRIYSNRRRPRIDAASTVRCLFEEIMIYNNYQRKVYFKFKPAMEIYFLLEQHFLVQSDCTFLLLC